MKKNLLLLLASALLLTGCDKLERYYPSNGGRYVPEPTEEGGGEEGGGEEELLCTYNFYFSYSATTKYNPFSNKDEDSPILSFTHAMLKPLGKCPDEVSSKEKVIALGAELGYTFDPAFSEFLGFSFNGVCLDESGLWNFETDYKQLAVVTLYGVWVSK